MVEQISGRHRAIGAIALVSAGLLHFAPAPEQAQAQELQIAATDFDPGAPAGTVAASGQSVNDVLTAEKSERRRFDMSSVERVRMRVWGNADLNGDYTVEADETISLPGLGRVDVNGRTPGELEKVLSERYSSFARRDVSVSLEVSRYKPYFIVGQIASPGSIEWRPGLKVIQAISLAGGIVRPAADVADPVRREQLQLQLKYSLAQLERLKAEKDGKAKVDASQQIAGLVLNMPAQQETIAGFMQRQNAALDEQRAIIHAQLQGLERDREGANRELSAAQTQEKSIGRQVDIAKEQLQTLEDLRNKNLISKPRLLAQRSDLIAAQVRHAETASLVERARGRIDSLNRQMVELQQQRRALLTNRIETLESDIAQLEAGLSRSNAQSGMQLRYHITREDGKGKMTTVTAAVDTEVVPGDVVMVSSMADEELTTSDASGVRERRVDTQRVLEASAISGTRSVVRRRSSSIGETEISDPN